MPRTEGDRDYFRVQALSAHYARGHRRRKTYARALNEDAGIVTSRGNTMRRTPEQRAVLAAIERTGNPADAGLDAVQIAHAMIWLADPNQPTVAPEALPHPKADRDAWANYAARLHLDAGGRKLDIDQLRDLIGEQRLWTTHIATEAAA